MGSGKKHKTEKRKRHRSRSRSYSPEKSEKHRHHKKHKKKDRKDYDSDVEIVSAPPPPKISKLQTPVRRSSSSSSDVELVLPKEDKHTSHRREEKVYSNKEEYYASKDDKHSHGTKEEHYASREDRHSYSSREDKYTHSSKEDVKHAHSGKESKDERKSLQSKEERHSHHNKDDRSSKQKKSPSPLPVESGQSHASLSIEETNKLRAKLGLKPLEVDSGPKKDSKDGKDSGMIKDDLGEFYHKPAESIAKKKESEKIKERISTFKQKRIIESSLSRVKTLGDSDSDEDAVSWVNKSRKIEEEKKKAAERAKLLDQMDEEFGLENLVKEEVQNDLRNAYTERDLKGLKVQHKLDNFIDGNAVILTLKDQGVLEEDDDVLVNVNMVDDERHKKNVLIRSKKPGYDAYDESHFDEYGNPLGKVLDKYDEEIEGEKKESFAIGMVDVKAAKERQVEMVKARLANKRIESLIIAQPKVASDYYNEEELVQFKKPKKKIRKIRSKKALKADDLISSSNDYLSDLGCRRRRRGEDIKEEPIDSMDVDDYEAPKEDLSQVKIEDEDRDLDRKMKDKTKKLRGAVNLFKPENLAIKIKEEKDNDMESETIKGSIVLNSTAEFCRTLGDIPTYGQAGNREENTEEFMELEMDEVKYHHVEHDETNGRGTWNSVDMEKSLGEPATAETAILDAEPTLDHGVGGALKLAMSKGYLQKEDDKRPSASSFAHLKAQNYSIEDKTYGDDEKFNRRDRFNGPTMEFREKSSFKPNVKLEYIDDDGHLLNAKEAFRYLSHKFHGKGPGKNKVEKRMKKAEQESLMKRMSSTDTPLGTLTLLQSKQKETQSPFIVLSGSKQMQSASISKSKN